MLYMTTYRKEHKRRLINMALSSGCTGVDGWKYTKVAKDFHLGASIFLDTDITIYRVKDQQLEVLCTRNANAVKMDLTNLRNFHILEPLDKKS
jgi:hypothetical protein